MTERKNNVDIPIEWTPGIPDGLTLKCPYCKQIPEIDYLVPDKLWNFVVPKKHKLGVVCLKCFVKLAKKKRIHFVEVVSALKEIFYATEDYTVSLNAGFIYDLEKCKTAEKYPMIEDEDE